MDGRTDKQTNGQTEPRYHKIRFRFICYQIIPFTECKLTVREQQIQESSLVPRRFTEKGCVETKRNIPHRKLMPECVNVTKANCVLTNWETDEYGNQVWAGNEACDPITWEECKLVRKDVKLGKNYLIFSSRLF